MYDILILANLMFKKLGFSEYVSATEPPRSPSPQDIETPVSWADSQESCEDREDISLNAMAASGQDTSPPEQLDVGLLGGTPMHPSGQSTFGLDRFRFKPR
jgi:hypothetical protein